MDNGCMQGQANPSLSPIDQLRMATEEKTNVAGAVLSGMPNQSYPAPPVPSNLAAQVNQLFDMVNRQSAQIRMLEEAVKQIAQALVQQVGLNL